MARATTPDLADDLAKLKEDITRLRDDLASVSEHVAGLGRSSYGQAKTAGIDKIDELRQELERTYERLRAQGEASVADVERQVQERPLLSLLAAFGIGMLATRLLARR